MTLLMNPPARGLLRTVPILALALAASTPAPAEACSQLVPFDTRGFHLESMPADGDAFPSDAFPEVRLGTARLIGGVTPSTLRPELRDGLGEMVSTELELRDFGIEIWMRLLPDEALREGALYSLRLVDPEDPDIQELIDQDFPPVVFEASASALDDQPMPLEFDLVGVAHAAQPPVLIPICPSAPSASWEEYTVQPTLPSERGFGTTRFFRADTVDPEDVDADAAHRAHVDEANFAGLPTVTMFDSRLEAEELDELCVFAVAEDAYGRLSDASDVVCTQAVAECAAGCSATDDRGHASVALLLLLAGLRRRGRR